MPSPLLHTTNPLWFPAGAADGFEGIPISNAIHYGHLAACSAYFLSVATGFNAGGSVALLDLSRPGRYESDMYHRTQCHSNSVTDLEWRGDVLATSSLDRTVKLWRVQSQGNASMLMHSKTLDHKDRVVSVAWCPTEGGVVATALYGKKVLVWNVESGKVQSVHMGSSGSHCVCWSSNGCIAVASRDKKLCIFDAEHGEKKPVVSMICHQGSKPWKTAFLDDSTLVTVGFGQEGSKELATWDLKNPSSPVDRIRCNQSSGSVIMNYYQGNRFLFLSGRGDNGIQVYKYENQRMDIVGQFQSPHPYRDICWMKQEYLDSKSQEIGRCFRLFQPDTAVVLSTGSRRRSSLFSTNLCQQDFGGPFSLSNGHARRKLSAPLIEPLSIRLQECDNDDEEGEVEETETVKERGLVAIHGSKFCEHEVVGVLKRPRIMSSSAQHHPDCCKYINRVMFDQCLANMHDKTNKNHLCQNTTHSVFSKAEESLQKPPSIPPKPRAKRIWDSWKAIPEVVHDRLNRMLEKNSASSKMKENDANGYSDKREQSDDEILYVTSAFNRKRTSVDVNSSMDGKRAQETDDEDGYATCSVSDLVAVFEAKAAQIAAMESVSVGSESLSHPRIEATPTLPLVMPPVTQAAEIIVLEKDSNHQVCTPQPSMKRASHLVDSFMYVIGMSWEVDQIYQPKPLNRMYTNSSHQRWSIPHSIGIQMSPALRYMQRSQRTSVHLPRSTLQPNNEATTDGSARRPSLHIPVSDSRERLHDDAADSVSPDYKTGTHNNYNPRLLWLVIYGAPVELITVPTDPQTCLSSRPTPANTYATGVGALQKWDADEKLSYLRSSKEAGEAAEMQTSLERMSIQLIPVVAPVKPSRLSLLDEFRLLKTQKFSPSLQNAKHKPSVTLSRSATFTPSYSSFIEPRRCRRDQGVMFSNPASRHPCSQASIQTSCKFYEGYAKYLRDLESTVRRWCSDCAPDTTQPESMGVRKSRGCEFNSESEMEKSTTYVQYVALPSPRKVKGKDSSQVGLFDEPRSDCDETCVGTMTDADSDALSSTYSASVTN
ncbi:unnamed protein product [Hydatigera taeniaeformis]|uniref:Coronin n=1 Tax=Hydatigena taeniaeformis TaxID=6205 RepID=A0A0R3X4K7_HYDTA|nr:unnamed protein product [Hydatigera taeniaeformis]